MKNSRKFLV